MELRLKRFGWTWEATFGVLTAPGGLEMFTIERAWRDNEARISCIPTGVYTLVRHESEKYPDAWALVGDTVSHYPEPGKMRSAILIHPANHASELAGCIAPGRTIAWIGGQIGVASSRDACEELYQLIARNYDPRLRVE
jgi:hypothetical protein